MALADGNLETAISLHFEAEGTEPSAEQGSSDAEIEDEPEVRPPILPTQEVLVLPDITCALPRAPNSIFDRFRDFAVETSKINFFHKFA